MPLDQRKLNKIAANIARLKAFRNQPITLTLLAADNTTSTLTVSGIFRPMADMDPSFIRASPLVHIQDADAVADLPQSAVSLAQLRSCVSLQPATPVGAESFANRYLITSIASHGIPPGGDRWILTLERQR